MQNSFATTLRMLREEKKLTQADLAGGHLSRTIISLYESGRKTPSYEAIKHIAERLGVAVDVFFGGGNEAAHKAFITLMQQAEKAEKRGDWADAVEMLDSAAALCGTYHLNKWKFYVDYHRGLALTHVGQWENAVEILLPLIMDPAFHDNLDVAYDILRSLGMSMRKMGQIQLSILFFRLMLHITGPSDHKWIRTQINLATAYELLSEYELAERHYQNAIEAAKQFGDGMLEAWALIGWTTVQFHKNEIEGCEEALTRAEHLGEILENDDILYAVRHNRLVMTRITGHWAEFERQYCELVNNVPNDEWKAQLLEEKILYDTEREDWMEADKDIEQALNLPVEGCIRAQLLISAGKCYMKKHEDTRAKTFFCQAVELMRMSSNRKLGEVFEYI